MSAELETDAAEYVLGTLDTEERVAFATHLATDEQARQAVARWERRLSGLADRLSPVSPPRQVWDGIERELRRATAAPPVLRMVPGTGRDGASGGVAGSDVLPALQRSLRRWRAASVLSGALAAALLTFVAIRELGSPPEDNAYIAAVNRSGDKPAMLVRVDLKTHRVFILPIAAEAPAGKSLQLWYIGAGKPPRSMGMVESAATSRPMPADVETETATFAVSVEPKGGSTADGPTGPVVYSGRLIKE